MELVTTAIVEPNTFKGKLDKHVMVKGTEEFVDKEWEEAGDAEVLM